MGPTVKNDEYIGNYELNDRLYVENTDSPDVYSVIYYANPEAGVEQNLFEKFDGKKMASCYSDANSFDELDPNLISEYKEPSFGEDGRPTSDAPSVGIWRLKYDTIVKFDTYNENYLSLYNTYYKSLYGKDNIQTNLKKKYLKIAQEGLNNAKVTEKDGEKTFSYQTYDLSIDEEGNIQENKDIIFNLTVTIDKDGYFKKYTNHYYIDYEYKNEITIGNILKKQ